MTSFGVAPLSRGVRWLLVVTVAVWVLQLLPGIGYVVTSWGKLVAFDVFLNGHFWRLITYMFLHDPSLANPWHILFNMLALWMFGTALEEQWGTRKFLLFYFFCGIFAGILSFLAWRVPIVGASGAILGLLTAYAYYFPEQEILFFFVLPMRVRTAVIIIGAISVVGSMSSGGGIAHLTHLGGIIAAIVYLKCGPWFESLSASREQTINERRQRKKVALFISKQKYYEKKVDPVLKKISRCGMESLTDEERDILRNASKNKGS